MAYVEMKDGNNTSSTPGGDTLIFLHGNPTSSYLWRNVMEPLQDSGRRLIAPDLIGMGDSDKLDPSSEEAYSFTNHAEFLDIFMKDCAGLGKDDKVILVLHDWGSALGFWWARRHPNNVKGIAYMEALVTPMTYDDFDPQSAEFFQAVRTPGAGEQMILQDNAFVEVILPSSILRNLTREEMDVYRAPYLIAGESRRSTLTWPRQVPINGTPIELVDIVSNYSAWMGNSESPKLLISATPGLLLSGEALILARTWPNQQEVGVRGIHFIQEDSPNEIATAIDSWLMSDVFEEDIPFLDSSHATTVFTPTTSAYLWFFLAFALLFRIF